MIAMSAVTLLVLGCCLGWLAHRAYVRFEAIAEAMNRQDRISRIATGEEVDKALGPVRVLRFEDYVPVRSNVRRLAHK